MNAGLTCHRPDNVMHIYILSIVICHQLVLLCLNLRMQAVLQRPPVNTQGICKAAVHPPYR